MNADHYTEIGSTHLVCQDYALSGLLRGGEAAYAIVSDGCSKKTSPHTEVGAQILCHAAKDCIELCERSNVFDNNLIGSLIIKKASDIIKLYHLPKSSLDATLIIALLRKNELYLYAWGDGYVKINHAEEEPESISISYTKEAPFYLSYLLEKERLDKYLVEYNDNVCEITFENGKVIQTGMCNPLNDNVKDVSSVIISSDGINSYFNDSGKVDVTEDFSGHRRTTGEFVKSNMLFHKKRMKKEGVQHYDDISVAVIDCGKS